MTLLLCSVSAFAYQTLGSWGGYASFWTNTVGFNVNEDASDSLSHLIWSTKSCNYDLKLKFTVEEYNTSNAVSIQKYVNSSDMGTTVGFSSTCIYNNNYDLVVARENLLDETISVTGTMGTVIL